MTGSTDPGSEPAADRPDLSVVIVAYNRPDMVQRCLESLRDAPTRHSVEIILVDNHGGDGTGSMVAAEFPEVVYIDPKANLGFARACNLGVEMSSGERVLLLNPDTEVLSGALDAIVDFDRAHPEVGLVGGRTLRGDGSTDPSSCFGAMTLWSLFCFATGLSAAFKHHRIFDPESLGDWQRDTVREVGVVTGCLLLCRREVWDELGGMDTRFFMYAEDADLSWRARRAGYRPSITPEATVVHHLGASSSSPARRYILRNTGVTTYIRKRWGGLRRRCALGLYVAGFALRRIGFGVGSRVRPGLADDAALWAEVWDARHTWLPGFRPVDVADSGVVRSDRPA